VVLLAARDSDVGDFEGRFVVLASKLFTSKKKSGKQVERKSRGEQKWYMNGFF